MVYATLRQLWRLVRTGRGRRVDAAAEGLHGRVGSGSSESFIILAFGFTIICLSEADIDGNSMLADTSGLN